MQHAGIYHTDTDLGIDLYYRYISLRHLSLEFHAYSIEDITHIYSKDCKSGVLQVATRDRIET